MTWGMCREDEYYYRTIYSPNDKDENFGCLDANMTGFPDSPCIIQNVEHSTYKPFEVRTNHGYGPKEMYFKLEKQS